ncbi:acyl carrier protein [Limosilactobacillus sp.]|uniref:acyl carrier protein n=1 Tax=Limosilactobacillus sp. TaxID=2773925 RepID=UPI00345E30D1
MTKEQIFDDVKKITVDELDVDADKITMDANIHDDLDADSLDVFEIMNELEDKYDIELDSDETATTISDVVDLVDKQIKAKEAAK